MNYIISIVNPEDGDTLAGICEKLELPITLMFHGHGTATKNMLDILGIASRERRVVMTVADSEKTEELIRRMRRQLYIDAPGGGVALAVPVKSVGGGRTLAFLGGQTKPAAPELEYGYELILVIANEGHTDEVMDAARSAGAAGGTVLHGKGTGNEGAEKFFKVSIAQEKELILIVSKTSEKAGIMSAIMASAGLDSPVGALVFSLPVSAVAGFSITED